VNAGERSPKAYWHWRWARTWKTSACTIHPHPTLSETLCFAAEMAEGITDLLPPRKK
jgi:dihydrolipoamide dehydrogenase